MDSPTIIADGLDRAALLVRRVVGALTPQELLAPPKPTVAWIVWHLTRVQDTEISALAGVEQAWVAEGWHQRFGMPPDRKDYAPGHVQTEGHVDAVKVTDADLLLGYYDAVLKRSKDYLATLSNADLDRILNEPRYQPLPTVGVRLVSIVADNLRHAGQLEYLSGFIRYQCWLPGTKR
jgi:hypothetical protein